MSRRIWAPGAAPMYDPCGMAGGSPSNNSNQAGGWGYTTGYGQGFPGSQLPAAPPWIFEFPTARSCSSNFTDSSFLKLVSCVSP